MAKRKTLKVGDRVKLIGDEIRVCGVIVHESGKGNLASDVGKPYEVHWFLPIPARQRCGSYGPDEIALTKISNKKVNELLMERYGVIYEDDII
jgi:hypothetical protein